MGDDSKNRGMAVGGTFVPAGGRWRGPGSAWAIRPGNTSYTGHSWLGYIWLVYSIFFVIDPLQRHSRTHWIVFAAAYLCFLAIYQSFHLARTVNQGIFAVIAMFVLGLVYVPYNQSAAGIWVYSAAYLPFIVDSVPLALIIMGAGCGIIALEGWLLHLTFWSWAPGIFFGIIVGISNMAVARQKRADSKLRLAHEEIEQLAKMAERERIARDLHDVLGHTLSVIVLKSELAGRLMNRNPDRAANEIADVESIARKALAEVREAIGGYRSEGLNAEIQRAQRTLDAAGVRLTCEVAPPKLNPAEETVLSLIVREAVTNIVRHAQASRCSLRFSDGAGHCSLVVEDDGRGGIRKEGNGLRGMRERIEALGGHFSLADDRGTRLIIDLPLQASREPAAS